MEELISFIENYISVNESLKKEIESCFIEEKVSKNNFLLVAGKICINKWFIRKGIAKAFILDNTGKEQVVGFHLENTFMTQIESYELEKPSVVYIQAIEDLELLSVSKLHDEFLLLNHDYLKFNFLHFRDLLIRSYQLQRQLPYISGVEKYELLIEAFPEIIHKAKLKDISSFLGVSQERLSRIRKKQLS